MEEKIEYGMDVFTDPSVKKSYVQFDLENNTMKETTAVDLYRELLEKGTVTKDCIRNLLDKEVISLTEYVKITQ